MSHASSPPPAQPAEAATPEKGGSDALRTGILVAVLVLVVGMWVVDHYLFQPQTEEAQTKLEELVREHNFKSIKEAQGNLFVSSSDVQKALGRQPTRKSYVGDYLVESYCWWGMLPLKRRYISVAYRDREGKRYHTHVLNDDIKKDDLPTSDKEAREQAEKAMRESANGPDRQMPVPGPASVPGATSDPAKADQPVDQPEAQPKSETPAADETAPKE